MAIEQYNPKMTGFNPELDLEHHERGEVARTMATPGFAIINRIMRSEVDKFIIEMINVEAHDDAAVLAKHKLSKAAAQFYQGIVDRLNLESETYRLAQSQDETHVMGDFTEENIDLGAHASTYLDVERERILEEDVI